MSKGKIAVFVLLLIAVASIVVWCVVSSNAKDEKVQQEIDAVVKVLDEASGDTGVGAVPGSEATRELAGSGTAREHAARRVRNDGAERARDRER